VRGQRWGHREELFDRSAKGIAPCIHQNDWPGFHFERSVRLFPALLRGTGVGAEAIELPPPLPVPIHVGQYDVISFAATGTKHACVSVCAVLGGSLLAFAFGGADQKWKKSATPSTTISSMQLEETASCAIG
jgi:hypothetical protein